jgi:hypothetical protein
MPGEVGKVPFDPKVFLGTVDCGRTVSKYRTDQEVFSQGSPADAVFYILTGRVKITVCQHATDLHTLMRQQETALSQPCAAMTGARRVGRLTQLCAHTIPPRGGLADALRADPLERLLPVPRRTACRVFGRQG